LGVILGVAILGQSISIDVQSIGIDEVGVAILFSGQSIGIDDDQSIGIDEAWAWQTFSGHRLRRFLERRGKLFFRVIR